MAQIYPARPRVTTRSRAERRLYEVFRDGLPDDYVVFHSVAWQVRDTRGGAQDGEADFIIVHPDQGVLVIEVKGGRIRYDGTTGEWWSNQNPIKDPFEQARNNKYSLLEKLKDLPFWRDRWLTIGHAVAFPDVVVEQDLRLDAPAAIILDARHLGDVRSWVEEVFAYWQAEDRQHEG
ncbi:MAG: NERD domain-containing protein, partial [Chloroflexi bacterium]